MANIDLNADLGEGEPTDAEILSVVSSCNVACGGHAGDEDTVSKTIALALANGVATGAHPSYADRKNFGRSSGFAVGDELYDSLVLQVELFADVAARLGSVFTHVKPHGALYNDAVRDAELADIIARVTAEAPGEPALVGMADSEMESAAARHGLRFIAEGFVDRAYESDGSLVSRTEPGAVHTDISVVTSQAVGLAERGRVTARNGEVINVSADTLCIHGDTPGAETAARAVRDVLESNGIEIRACTDI